MVLHGRRDWTGKVIRVGVTWLIPTHALSYFLDTLVPTCPKTNHETPRLLGLRRCSCYNQSKYFLKLDHEHHATLTGALVDGVLLNESVFLVNGSVSKQGLSMWLV